MQEPKSVNHALTAWLINVALIVFGTVFVVWLGAQTWGKQLELIENSGRGIAVLIECLFIFWCAIPSRRIIVWWMEKRSIRRLLVMVIAFSMIIMAIVYVASLIPWLAATSSDGFKHYMLLIQSA
jgi:hypothetical protein